MTKRRVSIWILAILTIGIGLVLAVKVHQKKWAYDHPLSDPKWGFQFYVPQKLPYGFRITDSRISVGSSDGKVFGIGAEMNFGTKNWIYSLSESRNTEDYKHADSQNFNPDSVNPTCMQRITKSHQEYRLCHWLDYDRISVYEIKFIKGNVNFDTNFPAKKGQIIPMSELDTYVDSFVKADPPKQVIRGI
jgi:hypothetical protein